MSGQAPHALPTVAATEAAVAAQTNEKSNAPALTYRIRRSPVLMSWPVLAAPSNAASTDNKTRMVTTSVGVTRIAIPE